MIKILLISKLSINYNANRELDDRLMYEMGLSLKNGNWLGEYNFLTLTKGLFFPLFTAFLSFFKIPYLLGLNFTYILGLILLTFSMKKIIKNEVLRFLFFMILLFHPVTFSTGAMLTFYRNSLDSIFMIFIIFACIKMYYYPKHYICNAVLLGIIIFFFSITREDWMWILLPLSIYFVIYYFKYKKLKTIFLVIILCFTLTQFVKMINYKYYGVYVINEIKETSYKDFLLDAMSIKISNSVMDNNWLNSERMNLIYQNSESIRYLFKKVEDNEFNDNKSSLFWINYQIYIDENNQEKIDIVIDDTLFVWQFKNILEKSNICNDAKCVENFWKKASQELEDAYNNGKLKKMTVLPTPFSFPIKIEEIPNLLNLYLKGIKKVINIDDLIIYPKSIVGSLNDVQNFKDFSYDKVNYNNPFISIGNYEYSYFKFFKQLNLVIKFYQVLIPILLIISLIRTIIYFGIKKVDKQWLYTGLLIFLAMFAYLGVLAYVHYTAYATLYAHYLQGIYILCCIGTLIFIFGGNFDLEKQILKIIKSKFIGCVLNEK